MTRQFFAAALAFLLPVSTFAQNAAPREAAAPGASIPARGFAAPAAPGDFRDMALTPAAAAAEGESAAPVSLGVSSEEESRWREIERHIADAFGVETPAPSSAAELRRQTAELIRNEPGLSMKKALVRAFALVQRLTPGQMGAADQAVLSGAALVAPTRGDYHRLFAYKGKIYRGPWETLAPRAGTRPDHEVIPDGHGAELKVKRGRGAEKWDYLGLERQFFLGGVEYVAGKKGLYEHVPGGWRLILPDLRYGIRHAALIDGRLHVATAWGLLARRASGHGWDMLLKKDVVYFAEKDGALAAATYRHGFWRRDARGQWSPEPKDGSYEFICDVAEGADGRLYGIVDYGKVVRFDGTTAVALDVDPGPSGTIKEIAALNGRLYLTKMYDQRPGTYSPIYRDVWKVIAPLNESLWHAAEEDVARVIAAIRPPEQRDPRPDVITDENGTPIFAWLTPLLALATAAAHWLSGPVHLAFAAPRAPKPDVWSRLDAWLRAKVGAKSASRAAEWRAGTAELLRNDPSRDLAEAMAESFVSIYSVPHEKIAPHFPFTAAKVSEMPDPREKDLPLRLDGKSYLAHGENLYVWEEGRYRALSIRVKQWKTDTFQGHITAYARFGGKLYVGTAKRLYIEGENNQWQVVDLRGEAVTKIVQFRDSVYVGTSGGVFSRRGGAWRKVCDSGRVADLAENGKEIFVGGPSGLMRSENGISWKKVPASGAVASVVVLRGQAWLGTQRGLQRLEGSALTSPLEGDPPGRVSGVVARDGGLYFSKRGAMWRLSLKPDFLKEKWLDEALVGVEREIELRQKEGKKGGDDDWPGIPLARPEEAPAQDPWTQVDAAARQALAIPGPSRAAEWRQGASAALHDDPSIDLRRTLADTFIRAYTLDRGPAVLARVFFEGAAPEEAFGENLRGVFPVHGTLDVPAAEQKPGEKDFFPRDIDQLERHDGKSYARALGDFFVWLDGKNPGRPEFNQSYVEHFALVSGRPFLAAYSGLFTKTGKRWRRIFAPHGDSQIVNWVFELGGKIYAATDKGLFARDLSAVEGILARFRRWDQVFKETMEPTVWQRIAASGKDRDSPAPVAVRQAAAFDGKIYLATANGVYSGSDRAWRLEFAQGERVNHLKVIAGRLYAATRGELFVKEEGRWIELFRAPGHIDDIAVQDGIVYVRCSLGGGLQPLKKGTFAVLPFFARQEALLKDIERAASPSSGADPLSGDFWEIPQ